MDNTERYFSPNYATASRRFRKAVATRGGRLDSLNVTAKGPAGEDLAIDVGWFGASNPRHLLVHSCGLHGVEGFAAPRFNCSGWSKEFRPFLRTLRLSLSTCSILME